MKQGLEVKFNCIIYFNIFNKFLLINTIFIWCSICLISIKSTKYNNLYLNIFDKILFIYFSSDLVQAYKSLQNEKEALEKSMKALTLDKQPSSTVSKFLKDYY